MMIKLFNTVVTYYAMFWSRWFYEFTRCAFFVFYKHNVIVWVTSGSSYCLFFSFYYTRLDSTGFIKSIKTQYQKKCCEKFMLFTKIWSRAMFIKTNPHYDFKTTTHDSQVKQLTQRITFPNYPHVNCHSKVKNTFN